jgi:lysophospholipase L1-like esterase
MIYPKLIGLASATVCAIAFSSLAAAQDANRPVDVHAGGNPVKLACVGDSITAGTGSKTSYPAQLQALLGPGWNVQNFGASGRTLLKNGDYPYQNDSALPHALAFQPDVVVIMLGTNDTKPQNWKFKDQYVADYKDLVEKFKALPTHPRIFIALPVPVPGVGNYGIVESGIDAEMPWVTQVAHDENVGLIDLHTPLVGHDGDFPDRVHPNDEGAHIMALTVAKALTGKDTAAQ